MDKRVLIVDDDPAILRLFEKYLSGVGYEVRTAGSGAEAVRIMVDDGVSILVTDWMMPEMDGLELCRTVRAHEGIGFTYVIIVTAHTQEDRIVQAFDAGVDDYLSKPVRRKELIARLRAAERIAQLQEDLDRHTRKLHLHNAEMLVTSRQLEQANAKLTRMATTDELTGLTNRREAIARLAEHWSAAERYDEPLACTLLDIDHFKNFNDTYGHAVGDLVLKETAARLRDTTRTGEAVCRVGGEEFLILCPRATATMAAKGAERLRRAVEANPIRHGSEVLTVTLSAGVAERDAAMAGPDDLLKAADVALYTAKGAGRNTVRVSTAAGEPTPVSSAPGPNCPPQTLPQRATAPPDAERNTVLLVDDDRATRALCGRPLQDAGYHVVEATDGCGALTQAERDVPSVILMDAVMPNMDGLEATRRLKANPLTRDIPVIFVVARDDPVDVLAGLEAGADDYISKPIREADLLLRVQAVTWMPRSRVALLDTHEMHGEQARAMAILLEFSQNIAASEDLAHVLDNALKATAELTCSRRISIMLPDKAERELTIARSIGMDEAIAATVRLAIGDGTAGYVYRSRQSVILNTEEEAKQHGYGQDSPIYASMPMISAPLTAAEHVVGVLNITDRQGGRPFAPWDLAYIHLLANIAASAIHGMRTRQSLDAARDSIVVALARLAEHRDTDTGKHVDRVTRFSLMLADQLRSTPKYRDRIDDAFLRDLTRAVPLHDIGKVAIPDRVLLKPGRLTHDEMAVMRTHARIGAQTLRSVVDRVPGVRFLTMAEEIAHGHHEWYDGSGYPRGLRSTAIPLAARITALADVYDAIRTKRPYKPAMSHERAAEIILQSAGTQFDPDVIEAFQQRQQEFRQLAAELTDHAERDATPAGPDPKPMPLELVDAGVSS